jgi:hypothetical protein
MHNFLCLIFISFTTLKSIFIFKLQANSYHQNTIKAEVKGVLCKGARARLGCRLAGGTKAVLLGLSILFDIFAGSPPANS